MRPLFIFETPDRGKSSSDLMVDRINNFLLPKIHGFRYKAYVHQVEKLGTTPVISISGNKNTLLAIPWIRPISTNKTIVRNLNDYPRLNILSNLKRAEDSEKIDTMYNLVQELNLYFIVAIQKPDKEDLFWIGKYGEIPKEFWETTYRKKDGPNDRLHFPKYKKYHFVKEDIFKKQISKYLRYES